jgi:hypothetical protein
MGFSGIIFYSGATEPIGEECIKNKNRMAVRYKLLRSFEVHNSDVI